MSDDVKVKINVGLLIFGLGGAGSFIFQWATTRSTLDSIARKVDQIAAVSAADHDKLIAITAKLGMKEYQ